MVKFLSSFCMFCRMLLYLILGSPGIAALVKTEVSKFEPPDATNLRGSQRLLLREKKPVPKLGEWLCYLSASDVKWSDVAAACLNKSFDRGVCWYTVFRSTWS